MSKLIFSSFTKSIRLQELKSICSRQQVVLRALSTRSKSQLLDNYLKLNQSSVRFVESNKSDKSKSTVDLAKSSDESKKPIEQNASTDSDEKEPRFGPAPKTKRRYVFSWRTLGISSSLAAVYFGTIYYLKQQKEGEWERDRVRSLGKAAIGGEFQLVDVNNKPVSNKDFLGKWCLIYFGFSHCPDVCPEEMEKMVAIYNRLKKFVKEEEVVPLFISVDPERDTPEVVKKYCEEFSPDIIGLTGSIEQVKATCKNYRVYFSPGPKSKDKDYIVDHTIIIYLINPNGEFVDYYGQTRTAEMVANAVLINMKKFRKLNYSSWF